MVRLSLGRFRCSKHLSLSRWFSADNGGGGSAKDGVERFQLAPQFELQDAWDSRIGALRKHGFEGGYEWITIVQKKFASAGKASAIDVDVAVNLAGESDQREDLVNMIYDLRHTNNAGDLLPSTEYATFRYLLKFDYWDEVFRVINDPINYGIFMNEHLSCMAIDRLLKLGWISGAAKLSTVIMQQEMFDSPLLNYLAMHSLSQWIRLPEAERIFDEKIQTKMSGEEPNEEEMVTFRFPFLKNPYDDDHFDLVDANALVRKSLAWFADNLPNGGDVSDANRQELKSKVKNILLSDDEAVPFALESDEKDGNDLTVLVEKTFGPVLSGSQQKLMTDQLNLFAEWNDKRIQLIEAQAERVNLSLRLEEIGKRRMELVHERDVLFFFENRIQWEKEAAEKDELFADLQLNKKEEAQTEREYAENLFEMAREITQGTYQAPGQKEKSLGKYALPKEKKAVGKYVVKQPTATSAAIAARK